jgi:hypothetical protein
LRNLPSDIKATEIEDILMVKEIVDKIIYISEPMPVAG